jgi:hypothetical protein
VSATEVDFDFDAWWRDRHEQPPFMWTVHGDVEVEMPGSMPAGAMLVIWQAGHQRGRDADLTLEETYLVAERLWGPEVPWRLLFELEATEADLESAVQRMIDEYEHRGRT